MPSQGFVPFDPLRILRAVRDVECMVIGGFAAVLYGAPTTTGDLDILPLASERNLSLLAETLAALEALVREPRGTGRAIPVTFDLLQASAHAARPAGQLCTRTSAGPIDILWRLHDGRDYRDLTRGSLVLVEEELRVRVIGLDDLIEIKKAAGRDRDRLVLPYLEEIRRRQSG